MDLSTDPKEYWDKVPKTLKDVTDLMIKANRFYPCPLFEMIVSRIAGSLMTLSINLSQFFMTVSYGENSEIKLKPSDKDIYYDIMHGNLNPIEHTFVEKRIETLMGEIRILIGMMAAEYLSKAYPLVELSLTQMNEMLNEDIIKRYTGRRGWKYLLIDCEEIKNQEMAKNAAYLLKNYVQFAKKYLKIFSP